MGHVDWGILAAQILLITTIVGLIGRYNGLVMRDTVRTHMDNATERFAKALESHQTDDAHRFEIATQGISRIELALAGLVPGLPRLEAEMAAAGKRIDGHDEQFKKDIDLRHEAAGKVQVLSNKIAFLEGKEDAADRLAAVFAVAPPPAKRSLSRSGESAES